MILSAVHGQGGFPLHRVSSLNGEFLVKTVISCIITAALLVSGLPVRAGDVAAGKALAPSCTACHGTSGISANPMWPNLAGQQPGYLAKQLRAFRDGTRTDPMMNPLTKNLSDEDIENLASYFSSLE